MPTDINKIFEFNQRWIAERLAEDSDFFHKMSVEQKPEFLFIGCSDSRVDPDEFTGFNLGEIFVHRNVGNIVNPIDLDVASVIQYAIVNLKIKNIIVCGHYGCGGIKAAMEEKGIGKNSPWLQIIKDIYRIHKNELEKIKRDEERYDRLVELNVIEQVENVMEMDCIQTLAGTEDYPNVYGWVYDMRTGKIIDLRIGQPAESNNDQGLLKSIWSRISAVFNKK